MGSDGFEPSKSKQQIYSLSSLAAWVSPQQFRADGGIRTPDQLITNQLLWPAELHRRKNVFSDSKNYNKTPLIRKLGVQM